MIGTERKDGCTFFGVSYEEGWRVVDVNYAFEEDDNFENCNKLKNEWYFMILFERNQYFVQDLGLGPGTFIKVE